jgi:hypothetical protein
VTQRPCEFFITLVDDLTVPEFVALTSSVIDYLASVPETTQLASSRPGLDAFLGIRAGEPDDNKEDFVRRHRATFMTEIEDDVRGNRAHFWVNAHAEMRHEPHEGPEGNGDLEIGRIETASFVTRHELGLYSRKH